MPSKRKSKARPKSKHSSPRSPKAQKRPTSPARSKARPATKAAPSKLAGFSKQILAEETTPVAVRSWSEAKTGSTGHQELLPKTGHVRPVDEDPSDASPEPRASPLAGPMAVPKAQKEEFRAGPHSRRKTETPQDFGQVELRQATASGGRHLTKAKAENLQRGASRIRPLASGKDEPTARRHLEAEDSETDSSLAPPRKLPSPKELTDFGEVEIGQQTLSGSRKVGKLKTTPDDETT